MKLDVALDRLLESETELAERLRRLSERHAAEHDIYHRGHSLAAESGERTQALRPFTERYRAHLPEADGRSVGIVEAVGRRAAETVGRLQAVGMVLLEDLRECYLTAQQLEIDWVIVLQAARAIRDSELVRLIGTVHDEVEHTAAWLRTRIKETAAQVLATS